MDVESLIASWPGEATLLHFDRDLEAWFVVALHSTQRGPAAGGTRFRPYASLAEAVRDAHRLAEGMTIKCALAELDHGGGKAVIYPTRELGAEQRRTLLLRYGDLVRRLGGIFHTGQDVGTSVADMAVVAETGGGYVHCQPEDKGGEGDSSEGTAHGVKAAIDAACADVFGTSDLSGRSVVVQGCGNVGRLLVDLLLADGATVKVADTRAAALEALPAACQRVSVDAVLSEPCDVLSPCAVGGVLSVQSIPQLACRVVAGAANNQLEDDLCARLLAERDIVFVPDAVASMGGILGNLMIENDGLTREESNRRVRARVTELVGAVLARSRAESITTMDAARALARRLLSG